MTKEELELLEKSGYSSKVIKYYKDKVNVGLINDADAALAYTGPCGDTIKLYLKIGEDDVIENAMFQYLGCPASAACGSMLTQIIKGKTLREAMKITEDEVLEGLGGVPGEECHCAELAVTTLQKTISKYEESKRKTSKDHNQRGEN